MYTKKRYERLSILLNILVFSIGSLFLIFAVSFVNMEYEVINGRESFKIDSLAYAICASTFLTACFLLLILFGLFFIYLMMRSERNTKLNLQFANKK